MNIGVLQFGSVIGDVTANVATAERRAREAAARAADVLLLPEAWNTGFLPDDLSVAEVSRSGPASEMMQGVARDRRVNVVGGSLVVREGGRAFNRTFVFDRSGAQVATYDKTHLFSPMGEDERITPGGATCRFDLDGVPCGCLICYDLRFPEIARALAFAGAELLFVAAQWPQSRIDVWRALLRARAIENTAFLAACNGCGNGPHGPVGGHSMVVNPRGDVLWQAENGEETGLVEINSGDVAAMRADFPAFREGRERYGARYTP